jgi:hypothetical protein
LWDFIPQVIKKTLCFHIALLIYSHTLLHAGNKHFCLYACARHSSQHLALMANHGQRVFRADTTHCAEDSGFNLGLLRGAWMNVFGIFLAFLSHLFADYVI